MPIKEQLQISDILTVIGWVAGIISGVAVIVISLIIYIFSEFKRYCAERFARQDEKINEHIHDNEREAEHNRDDHARIFDRIDKK